MTSSMKTTLLLTILAILYINCPAQEARSNNCITLKREGVSYVYLDTVTSDTIFENHQTGQKIVKSHDNIVLSQGSLFGGMGTPCGCTSKPHGMWIKRYRNGNLKETGEYFCNRKTGTWTYYHENGNIKKIETYQLPYLEFLTEVNESWDTLQNNVYLLSGLYAEYYENGQLKEEGRYEIVEEFKTVDSLITFHPDTYEDLITTTKGAFWRPKSIKTGFWKYVDETGKHVNIEKYDPPWYTDQHFRPLARRYAELLSGGKK